MSANRTVTWDQLAQNIIPGRSWILINSNVYDISDYIVQHPGGSLPLLKYAGLDATQAFAAIGHSQYAISLRDARLIGQIESDKCPDGHQELVQQRKQEYNKQIAQQKQKRQQVLRTVGKSSDAQGDYISRELVKRHNSKDDCWVIINGKVCNVTSFLDKHPGGASAIMQYAGKDATKAFQKQGHSSSATLKMENLSLGVVRKNPNIPLIVIMSVILLSIAGYISIADI